MIDLLRKAMYFGLGAAAMSREKIKEFVDELIARGDVTADEGRKLYEEFTSKVEEEGQSVNERLRAQVQKILKDMGLTDRPQVAVLEGRIAALERKLDELTAPSKGESEAPDG